MKKVELKKIINQYGIFECDIEDAIMFVEDLLFTRAKEIEQNEPYATKTIGRLRDSARDVWDLLEYVEDALEDDEE